MLLPQYILVTDCIIAVYQKFDYPSLKHINVMQVSYNASLVYTVGAAGWASVLPATGTLTLNQPASFTIQVTPSKAATGYSTVYLALMQTYAADANAQTLMGSVEISYFNFGPTAVNFTSIVSNGDGSANVSASVAVDFTAPSGSSVPMSGSITTDASNTSTACTAAGPSSIAGSDSIYMCEASVPIKVHPFSPSYFRHPAQSASVGLINNTSK